MDLSDKQYLFLKKTIIYRGPPLKNTLFYIVPKTFIKKGYETMETQIVPYWAQNVEMINAGILWKLTPPEINFLNPAKLIAFLKKSNSMIMIQRIMSQTKNEEVKAACMVLLAPKSSNKINGGTRKHRR